MSKTKTFNRSLKTKYFWLILFIGIFSNINAQDSIITDSKFQQTNLMAEFGGNGYIYSIGFDIANFTNHKLDDSFRIGASYFPNIENDYNFFSAFVEYNKDFGKKNHYLELGISPVFIYNQYPFLALDGRIGYRFNSQSFIFRIAFIPIFRMPVSTDYKFMPYAGISIGFPLKFK